MRVFVSRAILLSYPPTRTFVCPYRSVPRLAPLINAMSGGGGLSTPHYLDWVPYPSVVTNTRLAVGLLLLLLNTLLIALEFPVGLLKYSLNRIEILHKRATNYESHVRKI